MSAAMEGRTEQPREGGRQKFSFRSAIGWLLLGLGLVFALSFYKGWMLERLAERSMDSLKSRHARVLSLFQASYYFFYEDQFLPGIKKELDAPKSDAPRIEEIVVLSNSGDVIFDSAKPKKSASEAALKYQDSAIIDGLNAKEPSVYLGGFQVRVLVPSGQYAILYVFDGSSVRNQVILLFVLAVALGLLLRWLSPRRLTSQFNYRFGSFRRNFWRLRSKFLATIVLINLITAVVVFFTLSSWETREQSQRIGKEYQVFSQFATTEVISDFTNFFYFYYRDRFLPEVRKIIASNENLRRIRIASCRTGGVLFDSEQDSDTPLPQPVADSPKFSDETIEQLKKRDLATEYLVRNGEHLLAVTSTYRNENQEALFWVEYLFSFDSLRRSVEEIRHKIRIYLVPSIGLGLLIAVVFAQLLISPIKRLVDALQKVTEGNYDVSVDIHKADEIGDLVTAFNAMTNELRKKKELRKYLSDASYRQIMQAAETPEGLKLGGSRVAATVLFCDIRNFVGHCENLDAEEITAMLNEYFSDMVDVVYKNGGEVDKFIGDAFLAVFYASEDARTIRPIDTGMAPVAGPSAVATALQAIYCALEMREKLKEFNERRRAVHKNTIEIGVGITHGEIISGPIGSKDRMDFTVIGDVVNLASRIEKLSKLGKHTKIVFSNHVEEKVRSLLNYEALSTQKVIGKEEEVHIYELVGIKDLASLLLALNGTDQDLRRRSVELLGQSRNIEALPHVIKVLSDRDDGTRLQAALAIGKLAPRDHPESLDAMFGSLASERSEKVISAVIAVLGKICSTDRILELTPFLESGNERIVANTIEAMGQVRSPKCADLILPKLTSRNNRVKANAAMALFAAGHIEVIDTLKPMLMHSDHLMRSSAAFAIGELTLIAGQETIAEKWRQDTKNVKVFLGELQECVPMLVTLLRDPEPIVRRQAVIALGKIRDKSAVLPMIDMIDPSRDSKEILQDITQALRSIGSHKLVRELITRLS